MEGDLSGSFTIVPSPARPRSASRVPKDDPAPLSKGQNCPAGEHRPPSWRKNGRRRAEFAPSVGCRCPQRTSRICLRASVYECSKIGDAGESAVRLFSAANRNAKLFFDADGEFERVKGVEAEAAAHERLVVGNSVRVE